MTRTRPRFPITIADRHAAAARQADPAADTPAGYYRDEHVTLHTGDAGATLVGLPDASVNCVVTSPPYWGVRDYGTGTWTGGDSDCAHRLDRRANTPQTIRPGVPYPALAATRSGEPDRCVRCGATRLDGQVGLEATLGAYVETLRTVFGQLWRVLADDGTAWLNLGDCYASNSGGTPDSSIPSTSGGRRHTRPRAQDVIPPKNLLGMPWRVAFALQADGWILRNAIVWHKPNAMPESVGDRLSARHELLFLLVKQRRYYFDLDAIREPVTYPAARDSGNVIGGQASGSGCVGSSARRRTGSRYRTPQPGRSAKYTGRRDPRCKGHGNGLRPAGRRTSRSHPNGKNPGDVWSMATRPLRAAHFAAFPIDLPLRCIAAGCPPDGTVLDPFSGAGTTGLAARRLGRAFVGIDLNPGYHDIALRRLGLTHRDRPVE